MPVAILLPPAGAPAGAGALSGLVFSAVSAFASGFAVPSVCAFSISAFTTRPCGPEPETADRSIPACFASRRASGDANTRPPAGSAPFAAPCDCLSVEALGPLLASLTSGRPWACASSMLLSVTASVASGFRLPVAAMSEVVAPPPPSAFAAASSTDSPSSAMTAISVLTFTPSVPSEITIFAIVPSSMASTSMVALSVSISAITSPGATLSPSFTNQRARLPSSIVGERAGMVMLIGIFDFPCRREQSRRDRDGSVIRLNGVRGPTDRWLDRKGSAYRGRFMHGLAEPIR